MTNQLLLMLWFGVVVGEPVPNVVEIQKSPAENIVTLAGPTQGTTYHIKYVPLPESLPVTEIHAEIDSLLSEIDGQLSTYRDDSVVARFNCSKSAEWYGVSPRVVKMLNIAADISRRSGGTFDVTIAPLVERWGFGREKHTFRVLTDEEITDAQRLVGWENLEIQNTPPALRKKFGGLRIDLNGIAPGFAVDEIFQLFNQRGIHNFLIELGGEVRSQGKNGLDQPWRVGIERPIAEGGLLFSLPLTNESLSTSGDYRHCFEHDGRRYSHILDPRSGWPISNAATAVTVVMPECVQADAWTKPLLVLGPIEGLRLADELKIAACFVLREPTIAGESPVFRTIATKEFAARFAEVLASTDLSVRVMPSTTLSDENLSPAWPSGAKTTSLVVLLVILLIAGVFHLLRFFR